MPEPPDRPVKSGRMRRLELRFSGRAYPSWRGSCECVSRHRISCTLKFGGGDVRMMIAFLRISPDSALVAVSNLNFTCGDPCRYLKYDTFSNRLPRDDLECSIMKACALRYGLNRFRCVRLAVRADDRREFLERPEAHRLRSGIRYPEFGGKVAITSLEEIVIASRRIDYSS